MSSKSIFLNTVILVVFACNALKANQIQTKNFNVEKDFLLMQFDCKTDVDDLHSVAGLATLMSNSNYSNVKFHAVAGTYGIQEGLYVPPNSLFQLAFNNNWTDAHKDIKQATEKVVSIIKETLSNDGDVWIAEAGQSDFTAELVKVIQTEFPKLNMNDRIHLIQHSNWNEKVTSPASLEFVMKNTDYRKIPDGNAVGNGTPGFRSPNFTNWKEYIKNQQLLEVWQHAIDLSNKYNGTEGRYNNEAIANGGLDFSDLSEVCLILDIQQIRDTKQFFELYLK